MTIDQQPIGPEAIDLETLLSERIALAHGTKTLADGIRAVMVEAAALVDGGYSDEHTSSNTGLRAFASEAGGCARAIGLRMLDLAPMDLTPQLQTTFLIGDILHGHLQKVLADRYPGFAAEERWYKDHISGRADGLYHLDNYKTVLEIKSCSKSSFSFALWKGPKANHILQAALSALVLGAEKLHIIYVGKEPVKRPRKLDGQPGVPDYISFYEWVLDLDVEVAQTEYDRLSQIAKDVASGILPDTETAYDYIDSPDFFKFPCGWCVNKPQCKELGQGAQPLEKVLTLFPGHTLPNLTLSGGPA